ncbi:hypothetical protein I3843_03G197400 [Carya illinoinensis]|nr:hypothetical protein I3843_03G197400 [Carya illinoinensis]
MMPFGCLGLLVLVLLFLLFYRRPPLSFLLLHFHSAAAASPSFFSSFLLVLSPFLPLLLCRLTFFSLGNFSASSLTFEPNSSYIFVRVNP